MVMIEPSLAWLPTLDIPLSTLMTLIVMEGLLVLGLLVRLRLRDDRMDHLENLLEMFMEGLCNLIREIVRSDPAPYVPLVGTLFIFIFVSNLLGTIPGFTSPTGYLSVTVGLSAIVFLSVPFYGIRAKGLGGYLRNYIRPNPFMLPFNLLGEVTRTFALAIRLFGNIMSGQFLLVVVIGVVTTTLKGYAVVFLPMTLVLTVFLSVLGLITAVIQAYIFTVLALVYIGGAVESRQVPKEPTPAPSE